MQERKTSKYTDSEERIRHRQSELSGLEEGNSNKLRLQSSKIQSIRTSQTLGNDRRVSTLGTNTRLQSTIGQTVGTRNSTISAVRSSHSSKIAAQALWYVGSFYLTFLFPSWTRISQMMGTQPPFAVVACFTIFFPMQGLLNAFVFFRPKLKSYLSERRERRPDNNRESDDDNNRRCSIFTKWRR